MYNNLYNMGYSPYTSANGVPGGNTNVPNGQGAASGYASYYSYPTMYSSPYVTQPPQPGQPPMYPSQQSQQHPGYGYGYNMGYGQAQGGVWNAGGGQQRPPPPESYVCHKCNQKGHWITDCRQSTSQQPGGAAAQQSAHHSGGAGDRRGGKRGGARNGMQQAGSQRGGANRPNAMGGGSKGGGSRNMEGDDEEDEDDLALDGMDEEDEEDGGNDEEDAKFFCEPCEKGFPAEAQYHAHLASHAKCTSPGCEFSGSKRVLLAHYRASHGKYKGSGFRVFTVEGRKYRLLVGEKDEEVEQWRDERRKNFPTSSNIAKRLAERQAAGMGPGGKKRPRWGVKTTMASSPGSAHPAVSAVPEPVSKAAKTEQGASASGGLLGLVSGYGSSDEEEGAAGEKAIALKGEMEGQGQTPAPPSEQPQQSSQQQSEQQERSVLYGVCRAFLRGQCNSGNNCRYRHGPQKRGGPLYCRFFTRPNGVCREAASCKYVHDEELKRELTNWVDERRASNQQLQQAPNGEGPSQGEAGSASAVNSTPQQQQQRAQQQQQQQQRQRQQQPNKATPRGSQAPPKRESTLLRKLLGVEADRETRLVLECIRFLVGTNFLRGHKQVGQEQDQERTGGGEAVEVEEEAVATTAMAVDCH